MAPSRIDVRVFPLGDRRFGTNERYIELAKQLNDQVSCPVEFAESASADVPGDGAIVLCEFEFHLYASGGASLADAAPLFNKDSPPALRRRIVAGGMSRGDCVPVCDALGLAGAFTKLDISRGLDIETANVAGMAIRQEYLGRLDVPLDTDYPAVGAYCRVLCGRFETLPNLMAAYLALYWEQVS